MELYQELLKHHSPGNRYVYYPPTTRWQKAQDSVSFFNESHQETKAPLAFYFHLPFCRQMCTFCGCNINLSKKKEDHLDYIEALIAEFQYKEKELGFTSFFENRKLYLLFGGGTPNDLHPEALDKLVSFLNEKFTHPFDYFLSEANPRTISNDFLSRVSSLGEVSLSFGIEDFSEEVCLNVNRKQTPNQIKAAFTLIGEKREKGIDLIWGLPKQTPQLMRNNWEPILKELSPDWISFYPLADVPWMKTYQDAYGDYTLPNKEEKYKLYQAGHDLFTNLGYEHYGFGHFLKIGSKLSTSWKKGDLCRTVSGLLPEPPLALIGFGVGSLSLGPNLYLQNEKVLEKYKNTVIKKGETPQIKSHQLNELDKTFSSFKDQVLLNGSIPEDYPLSKVIIEELPTDWFQGHTLTSQGRHFLKNILQTAEKKHYGK